MLNAENQEFNEKIVVDGPDSDNSQKSTYRPQGTGDDWPKLLSKKWLACHFGCMMGNGEINRRRFRSLVLTDEVLSKAGISKDIAFSQSTKTFNIIQSMKLTLILRGFCLLFTLFFLGFASAQNSAPRSNTSNPEFISVFDTIPGQMVVSDSIIRMVQVRPSEYKYQAVLSTIVFDGFMVKEYQAPTSKDVANPLFLGHRFYHKEWGQVDPKRVLLFKTNQ